MSQTDKVIKTLSVHFASYSKKSLTKLSSDLKKHCLVKQVQYTARINRKKNSIEEYKNTSKIKGKHTKSHNLVILAPYA